MNRKSVINILLASALIFPCHLFAAEYEVAQKNKEFSTQTLQIKAGDTVKFSNEDPFFHNIFSLSEDKTFDLGSYPKGQSREVIFDKEGIIEVECAIHPSMRMKIEVKK
ncbi:MAG: methylamine utilization protein [Gammaproteobacteria bacterium]|nr:methylamine utilization protein [Gammaproteobacteria bacterium]